MIPESALAFLQRLVETPSPSGYEEPNAAHFREYVASFADKVETDPLGSVVATVNPGGFPKVMLAGHIDEIGFLIHYIDDSGYCYFKGIGGHDLSNAVGQRLTVHTSKGPVPGVIGKKPIHLLKPDERGKSVSYEDLWIDIGCTSKEETVAAGIRVGDPATYTDGWTRLAGDRVTARARQPGGCLGGRRGAPPCQRTQPHGRGGCGGDRPRRDRTARGPRQRVRRGSADRHRG